jgi:hypothetical protein
LKIFKIISINALIIILILLFFELNLKIFGKNLQISKYSPLYIHSYYRKQSLEIDKSGFFDVRNFRTAEQTITGDLVVDLYNYKGCKIVIIGDSFVNGDGLYATDTYPQKIKNKVKCKIFSFGIGGWTSLNYFEFHDKFIKNSNYDLLIVNLTSNDLHLKGKYDNYEYNGANQKIKVFRDILNYSPRAIRLYEKIKLNSELLYIFDKAINLSLAKLNKDFGVDNFFEKLYNKDNYLLWLNIVKNFNFNNEDKQIIYFFSFLDQDDFKRFEQISQDFRNNDINFLYCSKQFLELLPLTRLDWANFADRHPGKRHTQVYAKCLSDFINKLGL